MLTLTSLIVLGLEALELFRKLLEKGHLDLLLVLIGVMADRSSCSGRGRFMYQVLGKTREDYERNQE